MSNNWDIILTDKSIPNTSEWNKHTEESNLTYEKAREFIMNKEIEARQQGYEFTAFINSITVGNSKYTMVGS